MPNIKNIEKFEELTDKLGRATAIYFTEYHGLNVSEITELRGEFYKADIEYQVAKNSIIKLSQIRGLETGVDFAEAYHLHRLFF